MVRDGRRFAAPVSGRRRPGRLHELAESLGVGGRDVGQGLAVEVDSRPLQPRDELAVGQVVLAARRR